jgi:5-methylcytosine-specific restriction endonuclease McrA
MQSTKTLKLDSSYRPIEIVDAIDALVLCIIGKASAIETYTQEIRTVSESFSLPAVIVLNRYVKFRAHFIPCKRQNILWRDDHQCQYCGKEHEVGKLTIDHILPKSKGGLNTWKNLVTACKKCNQRKGNRTPVEANMRLIRPPGPPRSSILKFIKRGQISDIWENYLTEIKPTKQQKR